MVRLALAGCVAAVLHGCGASVFACADPSECPGGTCEASGYCSFPDDACPSGQRYGGYAPASLADQCVELPAGTSSEGGTSSSTTALTIATLESSASDPVSSTIGEASSSPSTTDPSTGESSTGEPASSSDSGPPLPDVPPDLPPCIVEDFDDGTVDGFTTWTQGPELVLGGGTLIIQLAPEQSHAGVDSPTVGFVDRQIEVLVVGVPSQITATQLVLAVGTGVEEMSLIHEYDTLAVRHDDGVLWNNRIEVEAIAGSRWRIWSQGGELGFERQPPDGEWELLWSETPPFDLADSYAYLYAGTWQDALLPGDAELDELSECPYP